MLDTFEGTLYVDDIEGQGTQYNFVGPSSVGLSYVPVVLVPREARFAHARFRTSIELSDEPPDDETTVGAEKTTVVAPVERQSSKGEAWFDIQTDRTDKNGSLTLDFDDVPEWLSEGGDTGYVRLELAYDHELTLDEMSFTPKSADRARGVFDPTTPGVVARWVVEFEARTCSLDTAGSGVVVGLRSVPLGGDASVVSLDTQRGELDWHTVVDGADKMYAAAGGDAVYAASKAGTVYAFDADTGQQRWAVDTGGEIVSMPEADVAPGDPGGEGPRVFVGNKNGTLSAIDADGTVNWTYETSESLSYPPVVSAGAVFCSDGPAVHALDARSGDLLWTYESDTTFKTSSLLVDETAVYVDDSEYVLTAIDRETGAVDWASDTNRSTWRTPPVMSERYVYVPTEAGGDGYDKATGDLARTVPGNRRFAAHDGEYYYSAGEDIDRMYAVSEASGRLAWHHSVYDLEIERMTAADGTVYLADMDGGVYALATTRSTQLFFDGRLAEFDGSDDEVAEITLSEDGDESGLLAYPSRYLPYYGDRVGTRFAVVLGVDADYEQVTGERQRESNQITEFEAAVTDHDDGHATLDLTELDGDVDGGSLRVPADRLPDGVRAVGDSGYVSVYLAVDEAATPADARPDEWY